MTGARPPVRKPITSIVYAAGRGERTGRRAERQCQRQRRPVGRHDTTLHPYSVLCSRCSPRLHCCVSAHQDPRAAGSHFEKVDKKLKKKQVQTSQPESRHADAAVGAELAQALTNGVRLKKKKKKQKNGQLTEVTAMKPADGDAAAPLPADQAALHHKAAKKEKRAKAKAAARALAAAQMSAVTVEAPVAGGNVGAEGAVDGARAYKKAKLAQRSSSSTAMAAVGSKELASLGADLPCASVRGLNISDLMQMCMSAATLPRAALYPVPR